MVYSLGKSNSPKRLKNTIPWINNKEIKADFSRQMKHLKHMGEYAYKGVDKKHGSFDKYWREAVYEARPVGVRAVRAKNSKHIFPRTTSSPQRSFKARATDYVWETENTCVARKTPSTTKFTRTESSSRLTTEPWFEQSVHNRQFDELF